MTTSIKHLACYHKAVTINILNFIPFDMVSLRFSVFYFTRSRESTDMSLKYVSGLYLDVTVRVFSVEGYSLNMNLRHISLSFITFE